MYYIEMGDGLNDSEKMNILFKNYLNFPTTHHGKSFDSETDFPNNTYIFSENIFADKPSKIPNFVYADSAKVVELLTSNNSGFNVDIALIDSKIHTYSNSGIVDNNSKVSKFEYDPGDNSILRLNRIKLDYLQNNSAAFGCTDINGTNFLKNIIPNNYSSDIGYTLSLVYTNSHHNSPLPVYWLAPSDPELDWGAPLFDAANGTIVFYDVNATDPHDIFDIARNADAPTFYLTATKYVGAMGISGGTGGTADNDHVEFNTVSGISPLTALNTTLSGEIVSTTAGGTANNDHVEFNTVSGISSLRSLNTTLSGEIVATTAGGTANNDHLDFETVPNMGSLRSLNTTLSGKIVSSTNINGDMTISTKLGIGTISPVFSLDVHDVGANNLLGINGYYLDGNNSGVNIASSMTSSITIRAENDILSGGKIIAESDRRIKKDIVDLSEVDSLALVRNLMPKKYHYIDSTQKGGELVYGYIAQEVKEVLPSAVQHIRGAVPSIFEMAQVSRSKNNTCTMLTFRHYDTQNLDPSCEVLKLVDAGNNDRLVHIAKVVDARRLEIEEQVEEGHIFVYGEEVQDFHVLSKDYINVVAVSALQQMDSQVTQLKEENRTLKSELNDIKKILQNNGMI